MSQTHASAIDVYEAVLRIFTSKDDLREWMKNPFIVGDKAVATNGYSLVAVPKWSGDYEKSEKTKMVYPVEPNCNKIINTEQIKDAFSKVPLVDDYEEISEQLKCKECNGYGEVEWEYDGDKRTYTLDADCPVCDGAGISLEKTKRHNGKKIYDYSKQIIISDSRFALSRIEDLLRVAELLEEDKVALIYQKPSSTCLFKIKDVDVLLMPLMSSDNEAVCANIA